MHYHLNFLFLSLLSRSFFPLRFHSLQSVSSPNLSYTLFYHCTLQHIRVSAIKYAKIVHFLSVPVSFLPVSLLVPPFFFFFLLSTISSCRLITCCHLLFPSDSSIILRPYSLLQSRNHVRYTPFQPTAFCWGLLPRECTRTTDRFSIIFSFLQTSPTFGFRSASSFFSPSLALLCLHYVYARCRLSRPLRFSRPSSSLSLFLFIIPAPSLGGSFGLRSSFALHSLVIRISTRFGGLISSVKVK